jgi:hypothetical protein
VFDLFSVVVVLSRQRLRSQCGEKKRRKEQRQPILLQEPFQGLRERDEDRRDQANGDHRHEEGEHDGHMGRFPVTPSLKTALGAALVRRLSRVLREAGHR